jgi:hypothetical protein
MGLIQTTFPILTSQSVKDPRTVYSEKEWVYIDAVLKKQHSTPPHVLEWNPYPKGTMFSVNGDPLNSTVEIPTQPLVNANGEGPVEVEMKGEMKVFGHSGKDFPSQQNVDLYNPWKCHTCGGAGESQVQQENTYYDGVYDIFNGLDCAGCAGTGKEAVGMYELLSEDDQKTEYKAHKDNGDF